MRIQLVIVLILSSSFVMAQLPNTDLYLMTFRNNGTSIKIQEPEYISGFNPEGYNNQPAFSGPNELIITSNHYNKDFTDFMRLDLWEDVYYRVTATEGISEYSPTPRAIPGYFSAVRVEEDQKTQSLWLYPNNHKNGGQRVLTDLGTVGYHHWLSEREVALFTVGETMDLVIGDIATGETQKILENIGRCFRQDDEGRLLFIHKIRPESWYIKSYDPETKKIVPITQTLTGSEDFELLGDRSILMAQGSKIYSTHIDNATSWKLVTDLSEYGIMNINRLTHYRNKLVVVDTPEKE